MKRQPIRIHWYCRTCWQQGISEIQKEEIDGFTLEGIRLKIQGFHHCSQPDVRLAPDIKIRYG